MLGRAVVQGSPLTIKSGRDHLVLKNAMLQTSHASSTYVLTVQIEQGEPFDICYLTGTAPHAVLDLALDDKVKISVEERRGVTGEVVSINSTKKAACVHLVFQRFSENDEEGVGSVEDEGVESSPPVATKPEKRNREVDGGNKGKKLRAAAQAEKASAREHESEEEGDEGSGSDDEVEGENEAGGADGADGAEGGYVARPKTGIDFGSGPRRFNIDLWCCRH